jgi:hypothetical protein
MTDKNSDETRQLVAEMREYLDTVHFAIELPADKEDPAHAQAKRRALKELQGMVDSVELLAAELGDVPAPLRR